MASKRATTTLTRALRSALATRPQRPAFILTTHTTTTTRILPHTHHTPYSTTRPLQKQTPAQPTSIKPSTLYNFSDLVEFTSTSPSPSRIIIDVREPHELLESGTIPGAKNIPVQSSPDAFFLSAEEFEDKFGFERPGVGDEVVFFCKAGVRSKAAAKLAQQAGFGERTGEYPGSWLDWVGSGGKVEKV